MKDLASFVQACADMHGPAPADQPNPGPAGSSADFTGSLLPVVVPDTVGRSG